LPGNIQRAHLESPDSSASPPFFEFFNLLF